MTESEEKAKTISLPLPELYVYKLQVLKNNVDKAKEALVQPLKAFYEKELIRQIQAAIAASPECQQAEKALTQCVDEVKNGTIVGSDYEIVSINAEKAVITATLKKKGNNAS